MTTSSKTGCNGLPGGHMATGWWGRDSHRRVLADQQHAKERALLTDQLKAGGLRAALWQSVDIGNKCSCYKESNDQADRKCYSCHGAGIVPGYLKFGYETLWMAPTDSDVTLTNVKITTDFKSAKIVLNDDATTGTMESGDKPFSRIVIGSQWEYENNIFIRISGSSNVIVEYSLDSGSSWSDISNIVSANPSSGTIRFRTTLTRDSIGILSPLFEIVRARYSTIPFQEQQPNGDYRWGPWILAMRNVPKKRRTKSEHGDIPTQEGLSFWTSGLSLFDESITVGSTDELIKFEDNGPPDFIEILDGVMEGSRYVIVERQHSDPFSYLIVQQTMVIRLADPVGPYNLVF